jgi:hypothetical protein
MSIQMFALYVLTAMASSVALLILVAVWYAIVMVAKGTIKELRNDK